MTKPVLVDLAAVVVVVVEVFWVVDDVDVEVGVMVVTVRGVAAAHTKKVDLAALVLVDRETP